MEERRENNRTGGQERREDRGEQEEKDGNDRGEDGACSLDHTGGRLYVGGVGRDAARTTGDGGDGVDDEDPLGVRRDAFLVVEAGLGTDGSHRAHRVEEVGQQQREDQQQGGKDAALDARESAEQVELAQGGDRKSTRQNYSQ